MVFLCNFFFRKYLFSQVMIKPHLPTCLSFLFIFGDELSLCRLGWPGVHYIDHLVSNSEVYLFLPLETGIKSMYPLTETPGFKKKMLLGFLLRVECQVNNKSKIMKQY